jgi:hypothetical protein
MDDHIHLPLAGLRAVPLAFIVASCGGPRADRCRAWSATSPIVVARCDQPIGCQIQRIGLSSSVGEKRETQILSVIEPTVGMFGDLQAIAGKAMPEIPSLDMPLLESSALPKTS